MGERLRDKTVPCQVQLSLIQTVTNSFPCGTHLHRMGLRGSNDYTLCQRVRNQREDDQHEGCGRIDPETLVHIQSVRCDLQTRTFTSMNHHCSQKVRIVIADLSHVPRQENVIVIQVVCEFAHSHHVILHSMHVLTETNAQGISRGHMECAVLVFVHVTNVVFRSGRKHALVHVIAEGLSGVPKPIRNRCEPETTNGDIPRIFVFSHLV